MDNQNIKKTPLSEEHVRYGGRMVDFLGLSIDYLFIC
jgi:glycine cleavage system aminomethyltransferase T